MLGPVHVGFQRLVLDTVPVEVEVENAVAVAVHVEAEVEKAVPVGAAHIVLQCLALDYGLPPVPTAAAARPYWPSWCSSDC